jgi:hypothetical protein
LTETTAHVPGELAGLNLGQIENVVDELGEALAFADDDAEILDHLVLGLLHLAVVVRDHGEESFFETAANDLCKAQHRGERSAQLVADGGEEGALGGVGLLGGGARAARFFKQFCVVESNADGGGDRRKQALIGFREAPFLIDGLDADDADDLAAGWDGHAEIGSGLAADSLHAKPRAVAFHILVDEQRLARADDL